MMLNRPPSVERRALRSALSLPKRTTLRHSWKAEVALGVMERTA